MPEINYSLAIAPDWVSLPTTALTAGGEATNRGVENLRDPLMGRTWRTPDLKPVHCQFIADYANADYRLSNALFLGNLNLPESLTRLRVRKGASVDDEIVRPLYRTNGAGDAFLASTNATGTPSLLDDVVSYVTPTTLLTAMSIRLALRAPTNPPAVGANLQTLRVTYGAVVGLGGGTGATVTATIYQAGVSTGLSATEAAFSSAESGLWTLDLRFDAANLLDPTGAGFQVRVDTTAGVSDAPKIFQVQWLATTLKRAARPSLDVSFLEATNASSSSVAAVSGGDAFDRVTNLPGGITPSVATTSLVLRAGFANPGTLVTGTLRQRLVVRYEATAGTTGSVSVTLWKGGVATAITTSATAAGGAVPHWLVLDWQASDLGATPAGDVEARVVTTPSGSNNVKIVQIEWPATVDLDPYDLDTGWYQPFPANASSTWGLYAPDLVGKAVQKSTPLFFAAALTSRYTRVEFALSTGALSFTDLHTSELVTYLDVGRFAEGPSMGGMNLGAGFETEIVDPSVREESLGGVLWSDEEETYRVLRVRLNEVPSPIAVKDLLEYFRRLGTSTDVLLVVFPSLDDVRPYVFAFGPLDRPGKVAHEHNLIFRADLQVREKV